ncbi:MAG: hypothetical protein CBC09_08155 [Cellvibrionales bacterium TMED49]|nr:hypothetical protein [Porticoccaceae bacterium]OUU36877.1 MAG: hypothetical protein CBC09_08155 [Cellvibrionales bacterium TMED49]
MILSRESSVSWRLNDLLTADRKAKEFAAVGWNDTDQTASSASAFTQWTPTVVEVDELLGDEHSETLDEGDDDHISPDLHQDFEEAPSESDDQNQEASDDAINEEEKSAESYAAEALELAKREAHDEGYLKGRDSAEREFKKSKEQLDNLITSLRAAQKDMAAFYNPLKKLSLHLAQQLVRGELTQSSAAIERLTKAALDDLEYQGEGPILVYLHPDDRDHFGDEFYDDFTSLELRADRSLSQGSVKISVDDTAIEDLIEQRLDNLSQQVLGISLPSISVPEEDTVQFKNQVEEHTIEGSLTNVGGHVNQDVSESRISNADSTNADPNV